MGSTYQADPSCFYFKISWILIIDINIDSFVFLTSLRLFGSDFDSVELQMKLADQQIRVEKLECIHSDQSIHLAGSYQFKDQLVELSQGNNFPWLISNVTDKKTGRPLAEGMTSRVLDFHGRKVGLIGLVEKEWLDTLSTINPEEVTYTDYVESGQALAKELRAKGCQFIIALTHMR